MPKLTPQLKSEKAPALIQAEGFSTETVTSRHIDDPFAKVTPFEQESLQRKSSGLLCAVESSRGMVLGYRVSLEAALGIPEWYDPQRREEESL